MLAALADVYLHKGFFRALRCIVLMDQRETCVDATQRSVVSSVHEIMPNSFPTTSKEFLTPAESHETKVDFKGVGHALVD